VDDIVMKSISDPLSLPLRVLFVCTHNRCRSILAESLLRARGGYRFLVASAGSAPAGEVHPQTLAFLRSKQLPTANLRSKSWDDLGDFSADVVITVCDRAASEACPLWLGRAIKAHWGVPDPTAVKGDEDAIHSAFEKTFALLQSRIDALRALPLREMNAGALQARLDLIGLAHH